jgi:hypothetical protein
MISFPENDARSWPADERLLKLIPRRADRFSELARNVKARETCKPDLSRPATIRKPFGHAGLHQGLAARVGENAHPSVWAPFVLPGTAVHGLSAQHGLTGCGYYI